MSNKSGQDTGAGLGDGERGAVGLCNRGAGLRERAE